MPQLLTLKKINKYNRKIERSLCQEVHNVLTSHRRDLDPQKISELVADLSHPMYSDETFERVEELLDVLSFHDEWHTIIISLFMRASECRDLKFFERLCNRFPQYINTHDHSDRTPLIHIVQQNRLEAAKIILENGADPTYTFGSVRSSILNRECWPMLYCTSLEMVEMLCNYGGPAALDNPSGVYESATRAYSCNELVSAKTMVILGATTSRLIFNRLIPRDLEQNFDEYHVAETRYRVFFSKSFVSILLLALAHSFERPFQVRFLIE